MPLTESQIMALERAAFHHLDGEIVRGVYIDPIKGEQWVSDEIDRHMHNAQMQTRLSIAVTTLIGAD